MLRQLSMLLFLLLLADVAALGQKKPKPGFNMFSKEQDIQIGQEGMKEIESQVKLVTRKEVNDYIQRIGNMLAKTPEADDYPYTFKVVWDESINAFALPGGPTYVHTGLILAAENEGQLAGVMGHELSHVALRHGTNQASKANLFQLGAMLGGSMIGSGGIGGQLAQLGIGFGANSLLLKFSRGAERDADLLGAYMMAQVGYNPLEAARFFEKLQAETGERSKVEQFFSSHPNPGNRTARIEKEIQYMPQREYDADSGQLARIQAIIKGMPPPKGVSPAKQTNPQGGPAPGGGQLPPAPTASSANHQSYQGREFALTYPDNWKAFGDQNQASVTFVPQDGVVQSRNGGTAITRGAVAGIASGNSRQETDLERDTRDFIQQIGQSNPSMKVIDRQARKLTVDGSAALLTTLHSDSAFAGETELDLLLTVARPSGLYYMVFIAPQREFRLHQPTFEAILQSIRFPR